VKVLVIDDEEQYTNKQCKWLRSEGYDAAGVLSEAEARVFLAEKGESVDIALVDMYMETGDSGLKLIRLIRGEYAWIVPIVVTGYAEFSNAAECMEAGSFS
jgi:DNA-binding NtrC family response regulator